MRPLPDELTEIDNHAKLYDLLQLMFGLGDFDDSTSGEPWFKHRMVESMKLKGLCRRRRTSIQQVAIAAWYAKEHHLPVRHSVTLFALIPKAMVEFREMERRVAKEAEKQEVDAAVDEAYARGRQDWVEQLMRAAPGNVRSLLDTFHKELA